MATSTTDFMGGREFIMKKQKHNTSSHPPHWLDNFVRWYCTEDYQDEVLGDLHELFERKLETDSIASAKWWYAWNALMFMRLYNLKIIQNRLILKNSSAMWKNYLKISYRHSIKNAPYIAINVVGLGLALACGIFAYVLVEFNLEYNQSFSNTNNIYQIGLQRTKNEGKYEVRSDRSPLTIGEKANNEIAGIENFNRFLRQGDYFSNGDEVFWENIAYADTTFFEFFDVPLLSGDYQTFKYNPLAVYIDQEIAHKYFGNEPAVGKTVYINFQKEKEVIVETGEIKKENILEQAGFEVAGVFDKIPNNTCIKTKILVNIDHYFKYKHIDKSDANSWAMPATFIKLEKDLPFQAIEKHLQQYKAHYNYGAASVWNIQHFNLIPFKAIGANRHNLNDRAFSQYNIDAEPLIIFSVIALLILLVAIFNFTNTAMAFAQKRVREIGIRKVLGGVKVQIIWQFLFENFITCMLALALSLVFATYFMAWIDRTGPPFELVYEGNYSMMGFLIGLLLIVSVISGIYPAFYIGSMKPSPILKGNFKIKGANNFTKILLGIQFGISFIAVFSGIVMFQNVQYLAGLDLGYDNKNVLYVYVDKEDIEPFLHDVKQIPGVDSVLISKSHITDWSKAAKFDYQENEKEVDFLAVNEAYLDLMDVTLLSGTGFYTDAEKGHMETAIINETLAKEFQGENPIGRIVKVDSVEKYVIGVVKDLIFSGYDEQKGTNPMVIIPNNEREGFIVAKALPGQVKAVQEAVKEVWKKYVPYQPYEGRLQADIFGKSVDLGKLFKELFLFLAILSVLLSASGLFALMSLTINRKVKEIGIRKVLGATFKQILVLINKPYIWIVMLAWLIGISLGYLVAFKAFLPRFKYHIDAGATPFIISLIIVLVIATLTMGGKVLAAANANPSDTLRIE
ncbi:MAG: FtsX-like permease family protein [Bacteroidota bacterium]